MSEYPQPSHISTCVEPSAMPTPIVSDGFEIRDNVSLLCHTDPCSTGVLTPPTQTLDNLLVKSLPK